MMFFAKVVTWTLVALSLHSIAAAETLEQLIAGAKQESDFHRRGANFWWAEDFGSARSGVQKALRTQYENPFCRRIR